jgi:hypothetical protein
MNYKNWRYRDPGPLLPLDSHLLFSYWTFLNLNLYFSISKFEYVFYESESLSLVPISIFILPFFLKRNGVVSDPNGRKKNTKQSNRRFLKPPVFKTAGSPVFSGFVRFQPVQLLIRSSSQTRPLYLRFPVRPVRPAGSVRFLKHWLRMLLSMTIHRRQESSR